MPPGQSGSVHCLRRGSDPRTLLGPDVYLAPAGLWVMGSQNPRNGGPLLLPLPHPLVSPLQCPHHGATQPLLPAGAPAAPKLNTGAALSQPGPRGQWGASRRACLPPPLLQALTPHATEPESRPPPQLPTSDYLAHCSQGPQLSLPPKVEVMEVGSPCHPLFLSLYAGTHTLAFVCRSPATRPAPRLTHSQGPQAVQTSEHGTPDGLQLVGGQVQLTHRGSALESPVFYF